MGRVTWGGCSWHRESVTSHGTGSAGQSGGQSGGVETTLTGFAHALRAAGVPVTTDRTQAFLRAASEVGVLERSGVYRAGRATLCSEPDHFELYDRVFTGWFSGRWPRPVPSQRRAVRRARWHSGELDARRVLREQLKRAGEPGRLTYRRQLSRPRRVVLVTRALRQRDPEKALRAFLDRWGQRGLARGAAVLPFIDDFLAGHSLATFGELTEVVAHA